MKTNCATRPEARVVYEEPFLDHSEGGMEFRLTYEGRLRSTNSSNETEKMGKEERRNYKHFARKHFHTQLHTLWYSTAGLGKPWPYGDVLIDESATHDLGPTTVEGLAANNPVGQCKFVPLVTKENELTCWLDVLVLRRDREKSVYNAGDIDNRVKTLVDVLSKPDESQGYDTRVEKKPIFVLLQNDRLLTKLSVEYDTLLGEVPWHFDETKDSHNDARVLITVRIKPKVLHQGNFHFG